ncbi:MAG: hypothetical protein HY706_03735 [Candidatus Hydrogenedentes bacterium]|nr:hypothetical protein [Candidatus Hydrogenedentota bacterium]
MPELPEVEMRRRLVASCALHQRVERVIIRDTSILEGATPRTLQRNLAGREFVKTHRHGKWLFIGADSGRWLTMHFGMTGDIEYCEAPINEPPYTRARFGFENGQSLIFTDPRKFGEIGITSDISSFLNKRKWGPDPTHPGFDRVTFRDLLRNRTGLLKGVLMNQRVIAGVGNLYADEMLFQTGLHPETSVGNLRRATIDALYDAMMTVFAASLAVDTDYERLPGNFFLRHRNYSGLCPKCRRPLSTAQASGRTTYYCPRHQRRRS